MFIRKPAVAGAFYPSGKNELEGMMDTFLDDARGTGPAGDIVGVVAPHAGYVYSGPVAAYSYAPLAGRGIECAVVLAPSHRARFNGASVIPEGTYETPLGGVEIESIIGEKLVSRENFGYIAEAHTAEHSLEVQVPFLQRVLGVFTIVPIIIGTTDMEICRAIGEILAETLLLEKKKTLIVISTDLSHYHSYTEAGTMDGRLIEALKKFDAEELKTALDTRKAEACGEGPLLTGIPLLKALGAKKVDVLKYATSGDTAGSKDQVVGYLSAAYTR